jgi:hypothetical protein
MAPTGTKIATTFGLSDVAIAVPVAGPDGEPVWYDLPSVESAAFKLNVSEVEQYGDDRYQGTFYHSQKGAITVKFNKLSMAIFEMLSGNTVDSSVVGKESMYFGTNKELIPPQVLVRALVPYRNDITGAASSMTVYWFKCDVKTPWDNFPGGERAKIGENTLVFNTYSSTKDEQGNALSGGVDYAFGRFIL